jgi:hypothetical protein
MFGRQPRLPIDVAFGIGDQTGTQTTTAYAKGLRERLAESYQLATSAADKARNRQKGSYDMKVRGAVLGIGDRVLVKQLAFEGRHKLADKWEEDVYCVLDQPNQEIPVFQVQKENQEGRIRTLHRNHLLPVGYLRPNPETRSIPVPKKRKRLERVDLQTLDEPHSESEESDVGEIEVIQTPETTLDSSVSSIAIDDDVQSEDEVTRGLDISAKDADISVQREESEGSETGAEESLADDSFDIAFPGQDAIIVPRRVAPTPPPRRSNRQVKPPAWMASGEFCMRQIPSQDWQARARFLKTIAEEGILQNLPEDAYRAMLNLVTGGKNS